MEVLHIILTVIQCLCAVALAAIVILQSGKNGMSSAITGSSDSVMGKFKSSTLDAKLGKFTKWIAGAFLLLTLVLNLF